MYPIGVYPQLAIFEFHFQKAASVYTLRGVRASSDMDSKTCLLRHRAFSEILCQLPKTSQPQGPPYLISRAIIYPSDWILPQQGYTGPLKKS